MEKSPTVDPSTATKIQITTPYPFCRLQNPSNWEVIRMVLGLLSGLVFLRIFIFVGLIAVFGSFLVICHHLGFRLLSLYILRYGCRGLLMACGHFWIPIDIDKEYFQKGGCPKIIVSNHLSNMEILHLLTLPFQDDAGNPVPPHFVTKETIFDIPVVGAITRDVLGSIGVPRKQKTTTTENGQQSKPISKSVTEQILERVNTGVGYGPIVIFAEGTTTNGTCLLSFRKGAFVPMVPVTPVLYSFGAEARDPKQSTFLPTYETIWGPAYVWRTLCQPFHRFECKFLDTISPDETRLEDKEIEQASQFAEKVRCQMSLEGDLPMLAEEYNYAHKLKYHSGMLKAFAKHPRGMKYAMCFAPMQKVFDDSETRLGHDVVQGTKFSVGAESKKNI